MTDHRLGAMEARFADIIWANEPVSSGELVRLCEGELQWKKSTTYTMLRRLCERGIFKNSGGTVTALMSKSEWGAVQGEQFLNDSFNGSLPKFLAAFTRRKKLSDREIDEIRQLIDAHKGE